VAHHFSIIVAIDDVTAGKPHPESFITALERINRQRADGEAIASVPRDVVTYFHVELPAHELILAEGLEVESYLDAGDRGNFENGGAPVSLFPNFAPVMWEARGRAPLAMAGAALARAREARGRVGRGAPARRAG